MADNFNFTEGSGAVGAADDVSSVYYPYVKLVDGTAESTTKVAVDVGAKANALRVVPANDITDTTYIGDIKFGESLPAGTNAIGKLAANTGVDIGDIDVTSVIAGVGATNLGKARDTALGATDTGVMALAVRDDTLTTLTPADGDFVPFRVSSTGQLHVTGGGGGTQYNIDTVLGGAATTTLAGVVRDDSLTTLTEADGDISVLRVSSTGALHVTGGGGGTEYTEDVATANPIVGTATVMERDDVIASLTPIEGDWAAFRCSAEGALWVQDFNSDAALALLGTMDTDTGVIAGDTTSIDGKITACNTGAVVLATGSAAIGKLAANSGVDIGDVDILSIAAGNNNIGNVDIVTLPASTNTIEIVGDVAENAVAAGNPVLVGGRYDATPRTLGDTDVGAIALDADGAVQISDGGNTITVDGTITANLSATDNTVLDNIDSNTDYGAVVGGGAEATALRVTIANDSTGVITVDGTVTANLSATDNAILDTIDAVLDTIDADTGSIKLATEIMDDWDATHASAAAADGPQIMGAGYSAGLPTDIGADADAVRICTDRYGRMLRGIMPQNFQATISSADAQSATQIKAKTADRKMYILSLMASTDTAMDLQFQDDTGPTVLIENIHLAANGGFVMNFPPEAPLVVNTNEDFDVITSAAGNISVTITGYLAP